MLISRSWDKKDWFRIVRNISYRGGFLVIGNSSIVLEVMGDEV